jgi:hypothetical protein
MSNPTDKRVLEFEVLKRYGAKWAVLAAMTNHMAGKGIVVPGTAFDLLKTARGRIESGCFSPCEVGCELAEVECQLFSRCDRLDQQEFQDWCNLLAEAMQGKLDYQRIQGIPALSPVKNDCRFLNCGCSS